MGNGPFAGGENGAAEREIRPQQYLGLHCVRIFVRDQDRSLRFYLDQLGFHLAFDTRMQSGDRWVAVAPPDGSAILSLVAPKPNTPEYRLIGRATQVEFVAEDVPAKFKEWAKCGVRFSLTPRLKRIKYDPHTRVASASGSSMLLGEQTPIWGGVFARFKDILIGALSSELLSGLPHLTRHERKPV